MKQRDRELSSSLNFPRLIVPLWQIKEIAVGTVNIPGILTEALDKELWFRKASSNIANVSHLISRISLFKIKKFSAGKNCVTDPIFHLEESHSKAPD